VLVRGDVAGDSEAIRSTVVFVAHGYNHIFLSNARQHGG
jgi:hypothetical protein